MPLRQALRLSTAEGALAQVHSTLTGLSTGANALTFGFAMLLGAGDLELGLVAAVPPLAALCQVGAAAWPPAPERRRAMTTLAATLARALWLPIGLLPLLLPTHVALWAFLALWLASSILHAISLNLWMPWIADLVPPRLRASYFARRAAVYTAAGLIAGLAAGWALDARFDGVPRAAGSPTEAGDDALRLVGFAWVFGVAALAGGAGGWLLWRHPDPGAGEPPLERIGLRGVLSRSAADARATPGFVGLLVFVACFGLANGLALPCWQPYQMEQLGLSYAYINGLLVAITGITGVVALPLWGRVGARRGQVFVATCCLAMMTLHPLYFLAATPERTWPMLVDAASSGIAWSGYTLAMFNLLLARATGPARARLFAIYAAAGGLVQAGSSVLAGVVLGSLPPTLAIAGLELDPRQQVFAFTAAWRALCVVLLLWLVDDAPAASRRALPARPLPRRGIGGVGRLVLAPRRGAAEVESTADTQPK